MYVTQNIRGEIGALESVVPIAIALGMRKTTVGRSIEMVSNAPIVAIKDTLKPIAYLSKKIKNRKLGSSIWSMFFKKKMIVTRTSLSLLLQFDAEEPRPLPKQAIFGTMRLTKTRFVPKLFSILKRKIGRKLSYAPEEEERLPLKVRKFRVVRCSSTE